MTASCNSTASEKGGKDLLLKICEELTASVSVGTTDDATKVLVTAHGLAVNDLIRFPAAALGTADDVTADQMYFVKAVTANDFSISETPGGTAIAFTEAIVSKTIEAFKTVGGLRSKSWSFNAESVDATHHGTNQWKKLLSGAGLRSVSVSGDGVYSSEVNYRAMEADAYAGLLVCLALVEVVTGRIYTGCFKISSLEVSGDYNAEGAFSMSADSSEEVTIYQAA